MAIKLAIKIIARFDCCSQPESKNRKTLYIYKLTCLVFNPSTVEGYAALFSCTAVVKASDPMTASM